MCNFKQLAYLRLTIHKYTRLPSMCLTGFAVGSIEYSLCIFRLLAYFALSSHKDAHLPLPETVSDSVCRWLDQVFSLQM